MVKKPRAVICGLPKSRPDDRPARIFGEGSACIWLWVWPCLLGWHRPVLWLFSSVTGNRTGRGFAKAGDLWGIDAAGELLIVEAKTCSPDRRYVDPFSDFLGPARSLIDVACTDTQADRLEEHWLTLLDKERQFIRDHLPEFESGGPLVGIYPGILPYSRHRVALQVWRDLYCRRVVPIVNGSQYSLTIRKYLKQRRARRNPPPHFIGLLASVDGARAALTDAGRTNMTTLKSLARGRVHAIVIYGSVIDNRTRIVSQPLSRQMPTKLGSRRT